MKRPQCSNKSCVNSLCVLAASLVISSCCGSNPCGPSEEELARQAEQRQQAEKQALVAQKAREQTHRELEAYATEHLPELARELEDLKGEVASREDALQRYAKDLAALGRSANTDKEYKKRKKELEELRRIVSALEKERTDAFLAWRAFQHFPDKKDPATMQKHTRAVARAKREAEQARQLLQTLRKSDVERAASTKPSPKPQRASVAVATEAANAAPVAPPAVSANVATE